MRLECTGETAADVAAQVRATVPATASVADDVAAIVARVREGGDEALRMYERRLCSLTASNCAF